MAELITLPRATLEQALEALTIYSDAQCSLKGRIAITALRAALEQAEPMAINCKAKRDNGGVCPHHNLQCGWPDCNKPQRIKPEQELKPFNGLTKEEALAWARGLRADSLEYCSCGDRPKGHCPGEWEPGCDLGNNPKYARRVPLKQEPVAWIEHGLVEAPDGLVWEKRSVGYYTPLYTHPPRREWRGLTEEEIRDGREQLPTEDLCNWSFRKGVEFAEAALKEKNHE
jgi:hypothetical protein